ncbi:MAG TPA: diguanylate cyclase [Geobacteraceae bacterium]
MPLEYQKILIVDDSTENLLAFKRITFGEEYETRYALNGKEALHIAATLVPDLIILDVRMPEMDGYEICHVLKNDPLLKDIPVIFVTALDEVSHETRGLELGAVDFITRPFNPAIVRLRIKNLLELKRQRSLLEQANCELQRLAREDGLTGLANRRYFNESIDAEIRRAYRSHGYLSLILSDVDFFKRYNDLYGHIAGDRCLATVGKVFRHVFQRSGDFPARYGGEEFSVILPDTPIEMASHLAEKLRAEVLAESIPHEHSTAAECVTLSSGVIGAHVTDGRGAEWFLREADKALYTSKERGRNRVTSSSFEE